MKIHLFFLITTLALYLGCDSGVNPSDDNADITPTTISSGIAGTVTFTGEWPANAAEVRMVTSAVFPPKMDDMIYGESIPMDTSGYDYEFELQAGTYKFVGIAWRTEDVDWNLLSFCGFHFTKDDSLSPASITIEDDSTIVTGANITVNRSNARVSSDAKIKGSITFSGDWPGEFTEARVIATTRFDITTLDLPTLNGLAFSESITKGTTAYDYEVPAFPGDFVATAVLFLTEDGTISVDNVLYSSDIGGLDLANTYAVKLDSTVIGPDFAIEF